MTDEDNSRCIDCGSISNDYILAKKDDKEILICVYCFKNNYIINENHILNIFIIG